MQEDPIPDIFRSATPRELLKRLAAGDPLEIGARCAAYLEEEALFLDQRRMTLRALAIVAYAGVRYRGAPRFAEWIHERVACAAEQLLDEELGTVASGSPVDAPPDEMQRFVGQVLGLERYLAVRACVAMNNLPREVRLTVWRVVVEGRSLDEVEREGRISPEVAREHFRLALRAIREWTDLHDWRWEAER